MRGEQSTLAPTSITTTGLPLSGGKDAGQRGAVDAPDHALHHLGGRHHGAGVAGGDESLRHAVAHQARRHTQELSRLARTACAALSSMVTCSLA